MFERNRVETQGSDKKAGIPVEVSLDDGRVLKGRFLIAATRSIHDVLNGPSAFLEFETYQGDARLIAKGTVRDIKLIGAPKPVALDAGKGAGFDPYAILGVQKTASLEELRGAYHRLSKVYHPDRYANVTLPEEVVTYLASMARRVNAAYAALEEPLRARQKMAAFKAQAQPVFESGPRI